MRRTIGILLACAIILSLALGVSATQQKGPVFDDAQLLSPDQLRQLERQAERIAQAYEIGIYILLVQDYRDYAQASEPFDVLQKYYHANDLGYGRDRQGMILMIGVQDRVFATFFYGADTEYAFNGYGQEQMEGTFLDNLSQDDWFGACRDYLDVSEEYLELAEEGNPVRESPMGLSMLFVLIAVFISFVVTRLLWMRMSGPAAQKGAAQYQSPQGLMLTHQSDQFVTRRVMRRRIERSDTGSGGSGSSSAHSGGGGSGRSGSF